MNKLKKTIEGLEGCVAPARKGWPYKPNIMEAGCEWYDCPYSNNCEDILFDALELLKAQEPVHVKYIKAAYGKWLLSVCGNCGEQIREDWKYCPICGKAVKWDD